MSDDSTRAEPPVAGFDRPSPDAAMSAPPTSPTSGKATPRALLLGVAGAFAGSVPLPVVTHQIRRALRGALVHDAAARHRLVLTQSARARLSDPTSNGSPLSMVGEALQFVGRRFVRKWTPVGALLGPAREGFETLALGRMLDRYFSLYRASSPNAATPRIDETEAAAIRRTIDRATAHAWNPMLKSGSIFADEHGGDDDLRDSMQRGLDKVILTVSRLPEAVVVRLDAALDEILRQERA